MMPDRHAEALAFAAALRQLGEATGLGKVEQCDFDDVRAAGVWPEIDLSLGRDARAFPTGPGLGGTGHGHRRC